MGVIHRDIKLPDSGNSKEEKPDPFKEWLEDNFPHGTKENLKKGNKPAEGTKTEPSVMPVTKKESARSY